MHWAESQSSGHCLMHIHPRVQSSDKQTARSEVRVCLALFGSKCISWLLPNAVPEGMQFFPGEEIRDNERGSQKAEACCTAIYLEPSD